MGLAKSRQSAYSAQKYNVARYAVDEKVWLHKSLFRDAVSRVQEPRKIGTRRFGLNDILQCISKNAFRAKLPGNVKIHDVIHVIQTIPHRKKPAEIVRKDPPRPESVPDND